MLTLEQLEKWENYCLKKKMECQDRCDAIMLEGDCEQWCHDLVLLNYVRNGKLPPHIKE